MVGVSDEDVVDSVADPAFDARQRLELRDTDREVDATSALSLSAVREVDMLVRVVCTVRTESDSSI
jgi:hypothetical protein